MPNAYLHGEETISVEQRSTAAQASRNGAANLEGGSYV